MGYIDKQNELLQKLHDTDYDLFDGDKEEALSFVEEQLTALPDYANIVIKEQIMLPIWQQRYEGEEYRENVQKIDMQRRNTHDCAINSMNILNRINSNLGLDPFFDVDTNDRHAVANAVGKYICEVYNDGIGETFDDSVYNKTQEYDIKKINERLSNTINTLETNNKCSEKTNENEFD